MVNFEYQPAALELLFGENGTGKSTVFDVARRLRNLITLGQSTSDLFPVATVTAWQSCPEQTFELAIDGNGGAYTYTLVIQHRKEEKKNRIRKEQLQFDGRPLYLFDGENAHLYRDNHSEGPCFPIDWAKSAISSIPERHDNTKLSWFRRRMERVHVLAIDPLHMESTSHDEHAIPDASLSDFASWYRHLAQDSPEVMGQLFASLGEVITGFKSLRLESDGERARVLKAAFQDRGESEVEAPEFRLSLDELSTGHRSLIALFTILHCAVQRDATICIDEPDNFVALRELQPWLTALCDRVEEKSGQCLIISHHPEFIDLLAVKHGARFSRSGLGPVRVKPCDWSNAGGLRPSELVARGWEG
jgi:predicted ATPase